MGGEERSKELRKAMPAAPCGYRLRFCKGKEQSDKASQFRHEREQKKVRRHSAGEGSG